MGSDIINGAFDLGVEGFMLLIVLIAAMAIISKYAKSLDKLPEKYDALNDKISSGQKEVLIELIRSNKDLSTQLSKSTMIQSEVVNALNKTLVAIDNNAKIVHTIDTKMDMVREALSDQKELQKTAIQKIDEMREDIGK